MLEHAQYDESCSEAHENEYVEERHAVIFQEVGSPVQENTD